MLSTAYQSIALERDGPLLRVNIDRAGSDLNTIDDTLHSELATLFSELRDEADAGAVIISGTGAAFTAGGDFDWLSSLNDLSAIDKVRRRAKQIVWDLVDIEIPIVAALNGPAIGLGASIALLCDMVVMAESAIIGDPHVRLGLAAGDGGVAIWPLIVGPILAKQYLLLGESLSASDAYRLGLVNWVVPDSAVNEKATEVALQLAALPAHAVRYTKLSINKLIKDALNVAFDTSTALEMLTFLGMGPVRRRQDIEPDL